MTTIFVDVKPANIAEFCSAVRSARYVNPLGWYLTFMETGAIVSAQRGGSTILNVRLDASMFDNITVLRNVTVFLDWYPKAVVNNKTELLTLYYENRTLTICEGDSAAKIDAVPQDQYPTFIAFPPVATVDGADLVDLLKRLDPNSTTCTLKMYEKQVQIETKREEVAITGKLKNLLGEVTTPVDVTIRNWIAFVTLMTSPPQVSFGGGLETALSISYNLSNSSYSIREEVNF